MSQPLNTIGLAKDTWLPMFSEDETEGESVHIIDPLLDSTMDFWKRLESHCVAGCCGIDAFDFWKENVKKAVGETDPEVIVSELSKIKDVLVASSENAVESDFMNTTFGKKSFVRLLDHLIESIRS